MWARLDSTGACRPCEKSRFYSKSDGKPPENNEQGRDLFSKISFRVFRRKAISSEEIYSLDVEGPAKRRLHWGKREAVVVWDIVGNSI